MAESNGRGWVNTIVAVFAIITPVMAGGLAQLWNDVVQLREHRAMLEERVAGMDALVMRLRQQIVDLDETLQREMRLLDDTASTRISEIDRRLQQEMRMREEPILEMLRALERVVFGKEGG